MGMISGFSPARKLHIIDAIERFSIYCPDGGW